MSKVKQLVSAVEPGLAPWQLTSGSMTLHPHQAHTAPRHAHY